MFDYVNFCNGALIWISYGAMLGATTVLAIEYVIGKIKEENRKKQAKKNVSK